MNLEQAVTRLVDKQKENSNSINSQLKHFGEIREAEVKLVQDERNKLNFLAFTIAGAILSFSPHSLSNGFVVVGLIIVVYNALVFGFINDFFQHRLNIKNAEDAAKELRSIVEPYDDAHDAFGLYLDDPNRTPQGIQERYTKVEVAFLKYMDQKNELFKTPRIAKKSPISIGFLYFVFLALGLSIIGFGLFQVSTSSL